ncbi:MAG: PDC sensor domain-containing protein [Thermoleophilia bacterium]|nr:PDC sensor domain-containing protein [Thermoleophilia bacterium]
MTVATIEEAARRVTTALERVFFSLDQIAGAFEDLVRDPSSRGDRLRAADLGRLEPAISLQLEALPAIHGAGVVVAEGLLLDEERFLEWWRRGQGGYERFLLNVDPAVEGFYDYVEMEWYRGPRDQGRRVVSGPYIDYRCADIYVLTFTRPVAVGGEFLGIAGADIPMALFESELVPALRRLVPDAVLVNSERRVVAASRARWTIGARLKQMPVEGEDWAAVEPVAADLGWVLAVARREGEHPAGP